MGNESAELAALRVGLARGYFSQDQLEAVKQAAAVTPEHTVLSLLAARHLQPAQQAELRQVYQQALTRAAQETVTSFGSSPGTPTPDSAATSGGLAATQGHLDPTSWVPVSPGPQVAPSNARTIADGSGAPPSGISTGSHTAAAKQIAGFEVLRELGRGGMGVVYEARSINLERKVALKVLLEGKAGKETAERFHIEAKAAARLKHPNIVGVLEQGRDEQGNLYMALELVEGESLIEVLDREGPLDPIEAAELTRDLAGALDFAHGQSVLHRDLKPHNVMLDEEGRPLLTDFGLAKLVGHDAKSLTTTGLVMGTPAYMPPEQASGEKSRIDERSDVYGLGATLYHMLTGQAPFDAEGVHGVILAVIDNPPVPPRKHVPHIDRDLDAICLKCLEKEPEDRYPNAKELAKDLNRYLRGLDVVAETPKAGVLLKRWARERSAVLGVVLASALVVLLVVGFAWSAVRQSQREVERAKAQAMAQADEQTAPQEAEDEPAPPQPAAGTTKPKPKPTPGPAKPTPTPKPKPKPKPDEPKPADPPPKEKPAAKPAPEDTQPEPLSTKPAVDPKPAPTPKPAPPKPVQPKPLPAKAPPAWLTRRLAQWRDGARKLHMLTSWSEATAEAKARNAPLLVVLVGKPSRTRPKSLRSAATISWLNQHAVVVVGQPSMCPSKKRSKRPRRPPPHHRGGRPPPRGGRPPPPPPREEEDQDPSLPCPAFKTITCGAHQNAARELRGAHISPQGEKVRYVICAPDGTPRYTSQDRSPRASTQFRASGSKLRNLLQRTQAKAGAPLLGPGWHVIGRELQKAAAAQEGGRARTARGLFEKHEKAAGILGAWARHGLRKL